MSESLSPDDEVPRRSTRPAGDLDMTPMVDVTFLLLIFFMVTASFSMQRSIQMPRQTSEQPSPSPVDSDPIDRETIELEIDESGAFLVLSKDWQREPIGKQNLVSTFKEAVGNRRDPLKLDIKVHEDAKLQRLVDGMDAGTLAGITDIQIRLLHETSTRLAIRD
ncbi:ExbD/TolR family protein [Neorhodopirellula pilleata]|uniref:Biopolymer transport protein ExbD/TolR n=1 Tax=Neorhodopirellula pilleata TaxID=2714738 RepID=A0A5C6AQY3_9BACT|nr:biopolymer transporter ExbD [Neorhodopirellula pilleata]TWU01476.1 Biopolymer transport protein ExbD/TolR [Neorhodopirellula pilleata]